jgi:hypothetical protein
MKKVNRLSKSDAASTCTLVTVTYRASVCYIRAINHHTEIPLELSESCHASASKHTQNTRALLQVE